MHSLKRANPTTTAARTSSIRSKLGHNAALLQLPIGKDSNTAGLVDVIRDRAIYFDGSFGETVRYDEVPSEYRQENVYFTALRKSIVSL